MKYDHKKIEKKWQEVWEKTKLYETDLKSKNPKHYNLVMFPYPSGEYLHIGHGYSFSGADVYARYKALNGFNVFEPIGYDSFGLPAENFAIKAGLHPKKSTESNIKHSEIQLKTWGCMFDWSRVVVASHPDYYKWTQWLFLQLYNQGLAYQKEAPVNWCPNCLTVLANEQVINGRCERCETEVIQKYMKQWFFKITDFSERLIANLDKVDWPESSVIKQRNWIGKSEGALIKFQIANDNKDVILATEGRPESDSGQAGMTKETEFVEVFTTRLDTIFGCTYMVLAPEHPLVPKITTKEHEREVENYRIKTQKLTDIERQSLEKEKTGVFTGAYAINPLNNEKIPIWISDYVILSYGTGAVMAVPAHDERDWEFAKKYKLPVKEVIIPKVIDKHDPPKDGEKTIFRKAIQAIIINPKDKKVLTLRWKKFPWTTFITGGIDGEENLIDAAKREITEETGYKNVRYVKTLGGPVESHFYANHKSENRKAHFTALLFELENEEQEDISQGEKEIHEIAWMSWEELDKDKNIKCAEYDIWIDRINNPEHAFVDYGVLIDSGEFSGLTSKEAQGKMADWLSKRKIGGKKITYRLRDWSFSRQRYWGAPIPIIYCKKCGTVPVPEKDLPVLLPDIDIKDVRPKGTGKGPLANIPEFVNTECPKCKGIAERETDTMDTFVDSSFYFLRYPSVGNDKVMMEPKVTKKWLPVDMYVGGAEHVTMHLLYARFIAKALFDAKLINFDEPFLALRHQGMILGVDGRKMSKSKGNVVIPDKVIKEYGVDAFRTYILFMGEFDEGGPWNPQGIKGVKRFLERYWNLALDIIENQEKAKAPMLRQESSAGVPTDSVGKIEETALQKLIHKTIKKVGEDINSFKFNTAVSTFMGCLNEMDKIREKMSIKEISLAWKNALGNFTILLSIFAPHLCEEVWESLGYKNSIFTTFWPKYDERLIKEEIVPLVIQVNGKVRDTVSVAADIKEENAKKVVLESKKIQDWIKDKKIKKFIFISKPGETKKLINIVVD